MWKIMFILKSIKPLKLKHSFEIKWTIIFTFILEKCLPTQHYYGAITNTTYKCTYS